MTGRARILNYEGMQLYDQISFKVSRIITTTYSTSFSIAVSFLKTDQRRAIYSIYGFVRLADEIVDTFHHTNQKGLLNNLERDFYDAYVSGISINPVLNAFVITLSKYNVSIELVNSFLKSMKADLHKHSYDSHQELKEYVYGSADVVGLMCLMVFLDGDAKRYEQLKHPAMKLGSAFQKVNFMRDLREDIEILDRKYFPELRVSNFNENVKNKILHEIEQEFLEAREGIKKLPGRSRLAVLIAFTYYKQLLEKLKLTSAEDILKVRIRVKNRRKMFLLGMSMLKYKLKMF